jgi:hypothetical protein
MVMRVKSVNIAHFTVVVDGHACEGSMNIAHFTVVVDGRCVNLVWQVWWAAARQGGASGGGGTVCFTEEVATCRP